MEISKYRMMSGIRSSRPNPMVIHRQAQQPQEQAQPQEVPEERVKAAEPRATQNLFTAQKYDKDHTFNFLQHRWFKKKLELDEEITMSARQLKKFCDEAHEMGKMRQALLSEGEQPL